MKNAVLSTGQAVVLRDKDELTEGQSRKIEIARFRAAAALERLSKPVYLDEDGKETFDETATRALVNGAPKTAVPTSSLDAPSDEEWAFIDGFTDALIAEMTVSFDGASLMNPTSLPKPVYDALNVAVSQAYGALATAPEGPDEKIDPLVAAVESTDSSSATPT